VSPAPSPGPGPGQPPSTEDHPLALDRAADAGGAALGASGAEATVELSWLLLLRHKVQDRAKASPRYEWWALSSLLAGLLALNITFTVFVVALPKVAHELHTNYSVLTWSSTGPLLAFGLAAPIFGKAGDLFGHRRLYLMGLAGAMVSAVVTATSPDVGVLLFGRALDGVQGAATGTASMAIILKLFGPEERVKALGWWSLVGAGGPVLGVTLGSPIIQYFGWRALFWGQLVLLVISAVVVALLLPAHGRRALPADSDEQPKATWAGMDWIGTWSLSASVTGFMLLLSIGPIVGWSSVGVIVSGMVGVVAMGIFVRRELTHPNPLLPLKYLRRRNFMFPMGARAFLNFGYFGAFFLFPLLMEQVYGYGIAAVGLISIARPLTFAVSSPIAGYTAVRVGERYSAIAGALSMSLSMVLFSLLAPHSNLVVIVLALTLAGLGMGVALPSTSSTMANEVSDAEYGVMSAAQLLAMQVGEVAGIQALLTIQESLARRAGLEGHRGPALLGSFHAALWVGAGVTFLGLICSLFLRPMARRAEPSVLEPTL
jgi:MFS family permease